ncbi:MAG: hypothetical protein ACREA9_06250 [Pyrinomonadaceae bacterium]
MYRFVGRDDYRCILDEMRLVSGHLFPIPMTLPRRVPQALHRIRGLTFLSGRAGNRLQH